MIATSELFEELQHNAQQKIQTINFASELKYGLHIRFTPPLIFEKILQVKPNQIIFDNVENISPDFFSDIWFSQNIHSITKSRCDLFMHKSIIDEKPLHIDIDSDTIQFICLNVAENVRGFVYIHVSGNASFIGQEIRVITQRNAHVKIITIQHCDDKTVYLANKQSLQKEDSSVQWFDLHIGGQFVKSDIISNLTKDKSQTIQKVLYAAKTNQQYDFYTASIHDGKQTRSDILTRGVIGDYAKVLSQGLVRILPESWGSQGYEQQDALLLSDTCEADAIPNLEIQNHDVSCSHGSTVGKIDAEKIHYLQTRGFTQKEAKLLIVKGYFTPVIEKIEDQNIKDEILKILEDKLV